LRIALASSPVRNGEISFNLASLIDAVKKCSGIADVIIFGETVLQGFDCLSWDFEIDKFNAVSLLDDVVLRLCDAAKVHHITISFGMIERDSDSLYSSQVFIDSDGKIIDVFRRVSIGWKDYTQTDWHYQEGTCFHSFSYGGKSFSVALCGDLWTDGKPEEISDLNSDIVFWPVWCDYDSLEWNERIKFEYAQQAALCGIHVLLVNPFCADLDSIGYAAGGAAHFCSGTILSEIPSGEPGILFVDI